MGFFKCATHMIAPVSAGMQHRRFLALFDLYTILKQGKNVIFICLFAQEHIVSTLKNRKSHRILH